MKDLEIYKSSKTLKIKKNYKKPFKFIYSLIDKGIKKNVFHKNTAARKKAQLASYLKAA
jgi:ribosomal protein S20